MTDPPVLEPIRRAPASSRRTWIVLGIILVAIGFLLYKGLGDATTYFRNVDEALAQRDDLGTDRFRLQGTVVPGSLNRDVDPMTFTVEFDCKTIEVRHEGSRPAGTFGEGLPVVMVGAFAAGSNDFVSDEIIVKHTEEYQEKEADRIAEAERQLAENCP
jgi:cytochrome c-type biogenesis protein CcmE